MSNCNWPSLLVKPPDPRGLHGLWVVATRTSSLGFGTFHFARARARSLIITSLYQREFDFAEQLLKNWQTKESAPLIESLSECVINSRDTNRIAAIAGGGFQAKRIGNKPPSSTALSRAGRSGDEENLFDCRAVRVNPIAQESEPLRARHKNRPLADLARAGGLCAAAFCSAADGRRAKRNTIWAAISLLPPARLAINRPVWERLALRRRWSIRNGCLAPAIASFELSSTACRGRSTPPASTLIPPCPVGEAASMTGNWPAF